MPYSSEHKQKSREKILDSALKLFTHHGYDKVTIDQLMEHAGLTRGAFYAHFSNKSDIYAESILAAVTRSQSLLPDDTSGSNHDWLKELFLSYLSHEHINQQAPSCPLAFLATDVANREPAARKAYTDVYKQLNTLIKTKLMNDPSDYDSSFAITAMMIGGVALGRALNESETVERMLDSCRQTALRLIDTNPAIPDS